MPRLRTGPAAHAAVSAAAVPGSPPLVAPGSRPDTRAMATATAAATYSFSSQPKPVAAARKKYREPGEVETGVYRDLKETCITWDKRVHRGNTYSLYTQNAIKEALQDAAQASTAVPKPLRRRKHKEPNIFAMPMPEQERIPVDLSSNLIAKEVEIKVDSVEAQTDEFLPEPPPEQYQPQKTGVDVHTQVEDGELFDFNFEVEPLLYVLVNKTLEQSVMEVEEEYEIESMKNFKTEWYRRQEQMVQDWQAQVRQERARWDAKEVVMRQKREEKRLEAQVLLKMQAVSLARANLIKVVPNAVSQLKEVAFPDDKGMAVNRLFLPQLLGQVNQHVQAFNASRQLLDSMLASSVGNRADARAAALVEQRARHVERERLRFEELQIRSGKIKIVVDRGDGQKASVGPVQLASTDSIAVVQDRVFAWLQANDPDLARSWPHGVMLCVDGTPVRETLQLFEAKAGQISMVPHGTPSPVEGEDDEEQEGGEEDDEGGAVGEAG